MTGHVNSISTISIPFPDGQRVIALAVEYDTAISNSEVSPEHYCVTNRSITKVYTNNEPEVEPVCESGNYVIIELDPKDQAAYTLTDLEGKPGGFNRGPGGPRDKHGPNGGPKKGPPPPLVLPNGKVFRGPHGLRAKREPLCQELCQVKPISAENGTTIPAWDIGMTSTGEINKIVDLFRQEHFRDIDYNLFVPEDYDPAQSYPLVLFIHDAGVMGVSPLIALEQGIGATVWARPEEQAKHPCFILAPQHAKDLPITNDDYEATDDLETIKALCDEMKKRFSIDPKRIYVTGQSMGFMSSLELMIRYPDYFAAGLVPAGHWDIQRTSNLWNKNVWMFISEEDRGGVRMFALPDAIRDLGGQIGEYTWSADQSIETLSGLVKDAKNDGKNFRLTVFPGDTIWRHSQSDRTDGGGHNGTWHLVYQLESLRDWLFEQSL